MSQSLTRYLGIGMTIAVIAACVAILNVSPAITAAAECNPSGGGGGGGDGGSTPSGTGSPSPSRTGGGGGLPITLPPPIGGGGRTTASPSGTPSQPPGSDESERCPTRLTIAAERSRASSSTVTFKGDVRSPEGRCTAGRDITLRKDRRTGKDRIVGSTVSNRKGSWRIREPRASGRYYAKASRRRVGSTVCLAGRSKSITP